MRHIQLNSTLFLASLFVSSIVAAQTEYRVVRTGATGQTCQEAVQGQIAWDYHGNTKWSQANVDRLCRGAHNDQPARCFELVMHGAIPWNSSNETRWRVFHDLDRHLNPEAIANREEDR